MKMGVVLFANNAKDNERFTALENGDGEPAAVGVDNYTWKTEIEFGDMIEPLGFDAIWDVEHHFSPYTMIPDPIQFLAFWAGRTKRVGVGTMVTVLPWHNPVRVAEQISMLQHMMGDDRDIMIGFGRGLAWREYGGLNVPMDESRQRFDEAYRVLRGMLENERFAFKGEFTTVPDGYQRVSQDLSLRPRPRDPEKLVDNFYVAWGSPQSVRHTAHLGLRPLIIPQREMVDYKVELTEFNELRVGAGYEPANATVCLYLYCGETDDEIELGHHYLDQQSASAAVNYEFGNETLKAAKGYEHYKALADRQIDPAQIRAGQLSDRPDRLLERITEIIDLIHPDQMIGVFKMGGMPLEVAEKSMTLFSKEVLPAIHEMIPQAPIVAQSV